MLVATVVGLAVAAPSALAADAPTRNPNLKPMPGLPAVDLVECSTGDQAKDRWAIFRGSMVGIPGSQSMRMNFRLSERVGRGAWRTVRAPGLHVLHNSQPGVAQFAYNQKIDALQAGTAYRVTVNYDWLDAQGKPFAHATRRSKVCHQRGLLPNVHPFGASVKPGPVANTERYKLRVRNTGAAIARGVEVRVLVDGVEVDVQEIGDLRPRAIRAVRFVGPVCKRSVTIEVDPSDTIRELKESDNTWRYHCSDYRQ